MKKEMIKKTGGCICGEIKFVVSLDKKPRVFNCHCIDCRKKIGGIITIIQLRDKYYLYAGMLDDISILKSAYNIFYENSHFPFMEISESNIKT